MIFGINTTRDISKLSQITYNNFEISLVAFMPNITTDNAITYTNSAGKANTTNISAGKANTTNNSAGKATLTMQRRANTNIIGPLLSS